MPRRSGIAPALTLGCTVALFVVWTNTARLFRDAQLQSYEPAMTEAADLERHDTKVREFRVTVLDHAPAFDYTTKTDRTQADDSHWRGTPEAIKLKGVLTLQTSPSLTRASASPLSKLALKVLVFSDALFLVSAYADFRSSPAVKIVMYASKDFKERVYCSCGGSNYEAELAWINFPSDERAIWRAGYLHCRIPDLRPDSRSIVIKSRAGAAGVMMQLLHPHSDGRGSGSGSGSGSGGGGGGRIGLCVKSGYGSPSAARFVEWMELNALLGVEHVMLYDQDLRGPIRSAMRVYADDGRLTVVKDDTRRGLEAARSEFVGLFAGFDATRAAGDEPFAQLELVSIQDCFHRFRGRFDYILVADIDEILVPTAADTLQDMLAALKRGAPAAGTFSFQAASYLPQYYGAAMPDNRTSGGLHTLTYTKRNALSWDGSKAIHETATTNSMNWHRRIDPKENGLHVHPRDAWLHHYRSSCKGSACDGGLSIADDKWDVLGRYALRLAARVANVTAQLRA